MSKRPSLFAAPKTTAPAMNQATVESSDPAVTADSAAIGITTKRPPSREGKRVLSIYLDPLAWKQLRQLALQEETSTQALGEDAINLLFSKHGLNRSA